MNCTIENQQQNITDLLESLTAPVKSQLNAIWQGDAPLVDKLKAAAALAADDPRIADIVTALVSAYRLYDSESQAVMRVLRPALYRYHQNSPLRRLAAAPPPSDAGAASGESSQDPTAPGESAMRVDPEIARIAVALRRDGQLRLWAILKQYGGNRGGYMDKSALMQATKGHRDYTKTHLRRLLAAGDGLFWTLDNRGRVWLTGSVRLAGLIASEAGPHIVGTNPPGARDMYIPAGGSLQEWRTNILTAWLAHRENPRISNARMAALFGVTGRTIRNWKSSTDNIRIGRNYDQALIDTETAGLADYIPTIHENPTRQDKHNWQGDRLITWRGPNTYHADCKQAYRPGKARRRRQAVSDVNPGLEWGGNASRGTTTQLYFENTAQLKRYQNRHDNAAPGRVWRGENRNGYGIWELCHNEPITGPNSMARGNVARRYQSESYRHHIIFKRERTFFSTPIVVKKNNYLLGEPDNVVGGPVGPREGGSRGEPYPHVHNLRQGAAR
jgi:hypothetical protein